MSEAASILVVNTYQKSGGAARAAWRTFNGIKTVYPSAKYLTLFKETRSPSVEGIFTGSTNAILARRLKSLDEMPLRPYKKKKGLVFSPAYWANPLRKPIGSFASDLVHLHWVGSGLLRVEELAKLNVPIVWTLHDAWAFTGGCHYTGDCEGYKKQCGSCVELGSKEPKDYSYKLLQRKIKAFEKLNITIVTPSQWLASLVRLSELFKNHRIEVIPNGLDLNVFKPIDTAAARAYFGIPNNHDVLLFGAQSLGDRRKGGDLLAATLSKISRPTTLLTFGEGMMELPSNPNLFIKPLGSLTDDASLALAYSAADVFVCPSREDNLPNTVAEALACGTPCASFSTGGLPDMIQHQSNGWLANCFDPTSLAAGIDWIVRHSNKADLRRAARESAEASYSMEQMTQRYSGLYKELLDR